MTFSGLWTRQSSPTGRNLEPPSPSRIRANHWTQLKSKLSPRTGHESTGRKGSLDAKVTARAPKDRSTRRLLLQIITPRPSVPAPRQSITHRPSQNDVPSGNQAFNPRSYREVPQDSSFANFVSECEHHAFARPRANTFGEARSAARRARTLDLQESPCEHDEARSSDQLPPIPSSNPPEPVETSKIPPGELSSTCARELLSSSFRYEGQVPTECLSTGAMAQAVRRRLRAQVRRARLVAEEVANPEFSLENLSVLGSVPPVETESVVVNHVNESAGDTVGSVYAVAPVALDAGLYEPSPESTVQDSPSSETNFIHPSQFHESFHTETTNFEPTSRDGQASSSSLHSVFEYDSLPSNPPTAVENPPSPNPAEENDVKDVRSVYDPVLQCFSLPTLSTHDLTDSAKIVDRTVDNGWSESARAEEESFVTAAPTPSTRVSRPENGRVVIKITPPSPPVTMRSQYSQRDQSINDTVTNLDTSHLVLPDPRRSRSSTKSDSASVGAGMVLATRFADNPSSPLIIEGNQDVRPVHMASDWPSNRSVSRVVAGSVERGNGVFVASVRRDTLPTSRDSRSPQTFGSSSTLVDQFRPPATIKISRISGMTGNDCGVVGREYVSAADKAEPSSSDAPILSTPVPLRKARKSRSFAGGRVLHLIRRQAHAVGSFVASSFQEWGNVASGLLTVQRSPNVARRPPSNPYFDPYSDGYVPPRGPSPDLVQPGGDVPLQPSIGNVYVKLD